MMMERSFLPKGHHQLSEAEAAVGNCDCAKALRFSVGSSGSSEGEREHTSTLPDQKGPCSQSTIVGSKMSWTTAPRTTGMVPARMTILQCHSPWCDARRALPEAGALSTCTSPMHQSSRAASTAIPYNALNTPHYWTVSRQRGVTSYMRQAPAYPAIRGLSL